MFTLELGTWTQTFSQQCEPQNIGLSAFFRITNKKGSCGGPLDETEFSLLDSLDSYS